MLGGRISLTKEVRMQHWRLAVVGLLAVAIIIGLVGFALNRHVAGATGEASRYGLRLENPLSCVRPHVRG